MYIQVMESSVDTTVLVVLGSAFGVMFATLTTLMVGAMRVQHRDSIETHRLITQASNDSRDLIERATDKLSAEFEEHNRVTERNYEKVAASLGDARERLVQIEGHLRIPKPPAEDPEPDGTIGQGMYSLPRAGEHYVY